MLVTQRVALAGKLSHNKQTWLLHALGKHGMLKAVKLLKLSSE